MIGNLPIFFRSIVLGLSIVAAWRHQFPSTEEEYSEKYLPFLTLILVCEYKNPVIVSQCPPKRKKSRERKMAQ